MNLDAFLEVEYVMYLASNELFYHRFDLIANVYRMEV